jgi:hypothetical protein
MGEVHEGICGTHQSASKMKWLRRTAGFYWPSMIGDCFKYYKGCEECQQFGNLRLVAAALMHPIIKPWPLILLHQKGMASYWWLHIILLWTESVPLKNMTHREVIEFITEHIIHRFEIPRT